ncbi:hypothetical protein IAT38_004503 [Cryptococcus sp. DSM 104549]
MPGTDSTTAPPAMRVFANSALLKLILDGVDRNDIHAMMRVSRLFFRPAVEARHRASLSTFAAIITPLCKSQGRVDIVVPQLFTLHPNLIAVIYRGMRIKRKFFSDGRPPVISYTLSSTVSLDSEVFADLQTANVAGFPSEWHVARALAIVVPPETRDGLDDEEEEESDDDEGRALQYPGKAEAIAFSKKLASRVLAVECSYVDALIVQRPMPLWAFTSAIREITATGRAAPGIVSLSAGYDGFLELMASLQPDLCTISTHSENTPHHLVELTPEELVNNVEWHRFPQLYLLTIPVRRPDTVDEHPFTDLHPVAPPLTKPPISAPAPGGSAGAWPSVIITFVYPPDLEVAQAQLQHDLEGLPRLIDALRIVLPHLRPAFTVSHSLPEHLKGPDGERLQFVMGAMQWLWPSRLWDVKFEEVVTEVWGSLPADPMEELRGHFGGISSESEAESDEWEDGEDEESDEDMEGSEED